MMSAGLSGWVSMNAPGYTPAKVADVRIAAKSNVGRYVAGHGSGSPVRRNRQRTRRRPESRPVVRTDGDGRRPLDRRRLDHHGTRSTGRGVHPDIRRHRRQLVRVGFALRRQRRLPRLPQLVAERGAHQAQRHADHAERGRDGSRQTAGCSDTWYRPARSFRDTRQGLGYLRRSVRRWCALRRAGDGRRLEATDGGGRTIAAGHARRGHGPRHPHPDAQQPPAQPHRARSVGAAGAHGPLRAAFAELADERDEHRVWMRHFN